MWKYCISIEKVLNFAYKNEYKPGLSLHSHLPNGQGPKQVICQLNRKKCNLRLVQGKQNLGANYPKGNLEFKIFSSPTNPVLTCNYLKKTAGASPLYRMIGVKQCGNSFSCAIFVYWNVDLQ